MFYSSGYVRQLHLWFEVWLCGVGAWQAQLAAPVCASACFGRQVQCVFSYACCELAVISGRGDAAWFLFPSVTVTDRPNGPDF